MKLIPIFLTLLFTSIGFAQTTPKAYLIANVQVKDGKFAQYEKEYLAKAVPLLEKVGAKLLVGTATAAVAEGKWKGNWNVIIEFPSKAAADSFYTSPEYQEAAKARKALSKWSTFVVLDSAPPVAAK